MLKELTFNLRKVRLTLFSLILFWATVNAGPEIYVLNENDWRLADDTVSVVDLASSRVIRTRELPDEARRHILAAPSQNRVYANAAHSAWDPETGMDMLSTTDAYVENIHALEAGGEMYLDPDGNRIYIAHESSDHIVQVLVYDSEQMKMVDAYFIENYDSTFLHTSAYAPDTQYLFLGLNRSWSYYVYQVDIQTGEIKRMYLGGYFGDDGEPDMAVSPDGKTLFLVDPSFEVRRYKTGSFTLSGISKYSPPSPLGPNFLAVNEHYLFITAGSDLTIINIATQEQTDMIDLCELGCGSMLPSPEDNNILYLLDTYADELVIVDVEQASVFKRIPVGETPIDLTFLPSGR